MDTEALRLRYRPSRVHVLLVGESPPANGTFFYACDSNLFRHTKRAFEIAFEKQWPNDPAFLDAFAGMGFYLDDLCSRPVNHDERRQRRVECERGVMPLSRRIVESSPERVIATPMSIVKYVLKAMALCRCNVPLDRLPFPVMHHRPAYENALSLILKLHRMNSPAG